MPFYRSQIPNPPLTRRQQAQNTIAGVHAKILGLTADHYNRVRKAIFNLPDKGRPADMTHPLRERIKDLGTDYAAVLAKLSGIKTYVESAVAENATEAGGWAAFAAGLAPGSLWWWTKLDLVRDASKVATGYSLPPLPPFQYIGLPPARSIFTVDVPVQSDGSASPTFTLPDGSIATTDPL